MPKSTIQIEFNIVKNCVIWALRNFWGCMWAGVLVRSGREKLILKYLNEEKIIKKQEKKENLRYIYLW